MENSPLPATRFWEKWPFEVRDVRERTIRLSLQAEENRAPRTVVSPVDVNRIYPGSFVSYHDHVPAIANKC